MQRFFDDSKRKVVVAVLTLGLNRRAAANRVGCHVATIYNEAERNKKFAADIAQAESDFELRHTGRIEKASEDIKYWRASAWSLERKFPEEYAQRRPGTVTPKHAERILAQFVQILARHIPDAKLRSQVVNRLWKAIDASLAPAERKGGKRVKP